MGVVRWVTVPRSMPILGAGRDQERQDYPFDPQLAGGFLVTKIDVDSRVYEGGEGVRAGCGTGVESLGQGLAQQDHPIHC